MVTGTSGLWRVACQSAQIVKLHRNLKKSTAVSKIYITPVQGLADAFHIHPHRIIQVTQQNLDNQFKNSVESKQSGRLVPGSWVVQILGCISKSATIPCNYSKNPGLGFWRRSQRAAATTSTTILRHPGAPAPGPRCDLRLSLFWQKLYSSVSQ